MKAEFKAILKRILLPAFLAGVFLGMLLWNLKQANEINQLESKLEQTQEILAIKSDQLNQIYMYQEREKYMEDEGI